mmetsp:Transcript_7689/g.24658  ORF Transcript_7689/g.24658 Transcript_7689/m.24658 type:complete len:202 (-) Transcript_7689:104-709(-)
MQSLANCVGLPARDSNSAGRGAAAHELLRGEPSCRRPLVVNGDTLVLPLPRPRRSRVNELLDSVQKLLRHPQLAVKDVEHEEFEGDVLADGRRGHGAVQTTAANNTHCDATRLPVAARGVGTPGVAVQSAPLLCRSCQGGGLTWTQVAVGVRTTLDCRRAETAAKLPARAADSVQDIGHLKVSAHHQLYGAAIVEPLDFVR